MSMKVNLASTSSLLPENNLWEKKNFKINFEDYGNLFSISKNSKKKYDYEIKVIFVADLIDYNELNLGKVKFYKEKLSKIIDMIDFQSKRTKKSIIYYSFYDQNGIYNKSYEIFIAELKFFFKKKIKLLQQNKENIKIINLDKLFAYTGFKNNFDLRSQCK